VLAPGEFVRIEELRKLIVAVPFRPFAINLVDGRAITVGQRDFALLTPDGRSLFIFEPEAKELIDVMLVTSITIPGRPDSGWEKFEAREQS
jgi:hypothetical protein